MLTMQEPETVLRLDTAAGLVTVTATCSDGKVNSAAIQTSPSFVQDLDLEIATTDFGRIKLGVTFGGIFYGLIDVVQVVLTIEPQNAHRLMQAGNVLTSESIIGSRFRVEMLGETSVGNCAAVLPKVTGRAWIYGVSQLGLDPTDPFPRGFALSDTWGPAVRDSL
jgi:proline racemase